jgi:hypothetical protein
MLNNELPSLPKRKLSRIISTIHHGGGSSHPLRKSALTERLEHIVLLELTLEGYVV